MRWLLPLFVLLFANSASAIISAGACSIAASHLDCWASDYASEGGNPTLAAYNSVVTGTPEVLDELDYQNLSNGARQAIWDNIWEAFDNGGVLDSTPPAGMGMGVKQVPYTSTEAWEAIGSRVAHALWVDVVDAVPWSIADFTAEEVEYLFNPEHFCEKGSLRDPADGFMQEFWDDGHATESCYNYMLVDHAPKRVYDVAFPAIGGVSFSGTRRDALDLLMKWGGKLEHGDEPEHPDALTMDQIASGPLPWYAPNGCHGTARVMTALARSLNISAVVRANLKSGGHYNVQYPGAGDSFLAHADDVYSTEIPGKNKADTWTWASANLSFGDSGNLAKIQRRDSLRRLWFSILAGLPAYTAGFCASGWSYVSQYLALDSPQDDHWVTQMQNELTTQTGCSP